MSWPVDYHMHTPLCRHAVGEPTEYAAHAQKLGLVEIGFSDHSPMKRDDFDNWRMRFDQLDEYVEKVKKAQVDHPSLRIRLALEVDYIPGHESWIEELSGRHPWDYLIGSVHYVAKDWAIDDPSALSKWKEHDAFEVWEMYFDLLTRAAESKYFEIIGHADLPKKFGIVPQKDVTGLYKKFVKAAARAESVMELNTAGLRKDCREIYPSRELLAMAYSEGVDITFGSDAHAPEEVGFGFADAFKLAGEVGYTHCCTFKQRLKHSVLF
jgi:histidinol-phosphatase (PHP family)